MVQEATINNDSAWLIPKAKARFVFKGVTRSETWSITGTSGTLFAEIEQVSYSYSGAIAVVDVLVEIEYNFGKKKRYRKETLCYGPKSYTLYHMGPPRPVQYYEEGSYMDEGWMDDLCTELRGEDD